jgi:hypothetical protein
VIVLSDEVSLVYILAESGVRGELTAGRVERTTSGTLLVFDALGHPFEYLSGERLRSWCVLGTDGQPIDGWRKILPEDLPHLFPID